MIQEFAAALRKQLRDDMNNYCDDMARGDCKSFEAYRYLCGQIRGLAQAEAYLIELAQKAEKNDD